IERELSGIDVACLVNNVGVGYSWPTYLAGGPKPLDAGELQPMLNVNCSSVARNDSHAAAEDAASGRRRHQRGLRQRPAADSVPAYVVNFSESVAAEVRHLASKGGAVKSVTVQTVTPFFVATKLSKIRRASFFAPSPDAFVSEALNLLGVEQLSLGCLSHSLQYLFMSLLPGCVSNYVLCSTMYSTMQRSLKKQGKNN
uniref:Hydroxysteroid 17-beta dehydrogenase 1 n=1 Tax=Macrostomum lignano TaxID=282301 RepID=A0A1I8IXH6_9PLAT